MVWRLFAACVVLTVVGVFAWIGYSLY